MRLFFSSFCCSGRWKDPVPSLVHWDLLGGGCADPGGREDWGWGAKGAAQVPQQIRGGKPAANSCAIVAADGGM